MASQILFAQNIKCGGCVDRIRESLSEIANVSSIDVEIDTGKITVTADSLEIKAIQAKLAELGYPVIP